MERGDTIVAVVVTHDRLAKLKQTVEALLASPLDRVIVVDNASTDGTTEWLQGRSDPRLMVEHVTENIGGAGGFARGMALARHRLDPDWVLLLDDDARPMPDAIARFRALDTTGADGVAAAVVTPNHAICEINRPSLNPLACPRRLMRLALRPGRRGFHVSDKAYRPGAEQEIDVASFVGLFLSRATLRAAAPEPRMFVYGDDVLHCLRLRGLGFRFRMVADIRFVHDRTAGAGHAIPPWKVFYLVRNKLIVYRHVAGPLVMLLLPALLCLWVHRWLRSGAGAVHLRMLLAGLRDGLSGRLDRSPAAVRRLARATPPSEKPYRVAQRAQIGHSVQGEAVTVAEV